MLRKRLMLVFGLLIVASMVLAACGADTTEAPEVVTTEEAETPVVETEAPRTTRTGAWVDQVVFTSIDQAEAALTQLQAGEIDIYAYSVNDPVLFDTVKADDNLSYTTAFGSYSELSFNPSGPEFLDGRLNPFSSPVIREAMNMLVDRDYIAQEIYGGLAVPKFTSLNSSFADYARYVATNRAIEAFYAYNPERANEIITAEMIAMGAELVDGLWSYNGAQLTIIIIIRTEDERMEIGDYVGSQLESVGFAVDRQYKTRSEASPIWVQSDPAEGQWHIYTGGWITTAISRDDGTNFSFFYTPRDYPIPLHQAYTPTEEFDAVALRLRNNDFTSMEERGELFEQALWLAQQDSSRVWLIDQISFSPQVANLEVAYDLAGGVAGSALWPYTIRFTGEEGGVVSWAQPGVLIEPWNPLAGSNWIYDQTPQRATQDTGTMPDPFTGLAWPHKIESMDVVATTGLPIARTLDWVTLSFVDQIDVPADAWADWDAVNQVFLTVGEVYPDGVTSQVKVTVTYPADLWETVSWHDGSPLTMGDFIMGMIMTFDPGKPDSAIYDEATGANVEAYLAHFRGVRILSTDPLTIETYDDLYALDAENNAVTWWPTFAYGTAPWHNLAIGVQAETDAQLAFSADKADALEVEWMSYISGPSLDILSSYVDANVGAGFIPYAATLGQYVTAEEADARFANLQAWYAERGHFWNGTGPFYLESVYPVEQTLTLARNPNYPDLADEWARFSEPKIAVVDLTGPTSVAAGEEATFDVFVTFNDAPYPGAEISGVQYLVYDATGTLVATGEATFVADGQYQIVLPTDGFAAGSNKVEVAVTSYVVSIPSFASFEFVTTAP
ncbi:MAG: hypothetical protein JXB85_12280 [Anaerolineales bacterium]|nr:hypothetical protein [Anaerolineales bacterium]